jgi:hypothetical protein
MNKPLEIESLINRLDLNTGDTHLVNKREYDDGFHYRIGIANDDDDDRRVLWLCDFCDIDAFYTFLLKRATQKRYERRVTVRRNTLEGWLGSRQSA